MAVRTLVIPSRTRPTRPTPTIKDVAWISPKHARLVLDVEMLSRYARDLETFLKHDNLVAVASQARAISILSRNIAEDAQRITGAIE